MAIVGFISVPLPWVELNRFAVGKNELPLEL